MINIILIFLMTLLGSFGAYGLKKASDFTNIFEIFKNKYLYLAGICYGVSLLINIYLLSIYDYSILLPLTSLTYVWSLFIANKFLGEKITKNKVISICIIFVGVMFIGLSS